VHEREIGIDMGRLATLRCGSALAHNMFIESSAADIGQSNAKVVQTGNVPTSRDKIHIETKS